MRKLVFRVCCTIIGLLCLAFMICLLIDNWADSSLIDKAITTLAILGWVGISYDLFTLKYRWLRRIVGEE